MVLRRWHQNCYFAAPFLGNLPGSWNQVHGVRRAEPRIRSKRTGTIWSHGTGIKQKKLGVPSCNLISLHNISRIFPVFEVDIKWQVDMPKNCHQLYISRKCHRTWPEIPTVYGIPHLKDVTAMFLKRYIYRMF